MGLLSKFRPERPPTAEIAAQSVDNDGAADKSESPNLSQIENGDNSPSVANGFHVTPEMERRVVRKLDTRLVPLVMVLCKSQFSS
jgi:hypothetical protein